ncbi:LADA_0H01398g1_1 [Lachancea dasiensis]|uniref:LADA_0H01398g1_1 n=1 Tax=Lachancea dasiensis TaxID=1072105 RepID=A0A1G4JZ81_9SACH|nr:LADA_0H01398g1_1 [Lachancea dasiensis]
MSPTPSPPSHATVLESVFVDLLFSPRGTEPFSTATIGTSTHSLLYRVQSTSSNGRSTATYLQLMSTSSSDARAEATPPSESSSATIVLNNVSRDQDGSSATIALAIGLPLGVFCLGFCLVVFYLWCRRQNAMLYPQTPFQARSGAPFPPRRLRSKVWTRLFHPDSSQCYYSEKYGSRSVPSHQDSGATISYKITSIDPESEPVSKHIQTPDKLAFPVSKSFSSNQINALLYSKPPGIQSIGSALPTANAPSDSSIRTTQNAISPEPGAWNYESPLSRWFLTKSTYLQDQVKQPLKSSTVMLKQLNILSRVSRNRVQSFLPDESSPILSNAISPVDRDSYVAEKGDPLVVRSTSPKALSTFKSSSANIRDTRLMNSKDISNFNPYSHSTTSVAAIKPQTIAPSKIDAVTLRKPMPKFLKDDGKLLGPPASTNKKHQGHDQKLEKHLNTVKSVKPLPLTPNIKQTTADEFSRPHSLQLVGRRVPALSPPTSETLQICEVVRAYEPNLTDEISIKNHEYVRLLARHTDGWCLVEKCQPSGSPLDASNDPKHCKIDGEFYLNDYRGIVPGVCLKDVEG